jgi:hypothetical protein
VTSTFEVGGDPDVLAYDRALGMLYVATESGVVHLFKAKLPGWTRWAKCQSAPTHIR